jgi:hypothetical protein
MVKVLYMVDALGLLATAITVGIGINRVTANRKGLGLNRATRKHRQTEEAFKQDYLAVGKGALQPLKPSGGKPDPELFFLESFSVSTWFETVRLEVAPK